MKVFFVCILVVNILSAKSASSESAYQGGVFQDFDCPGPGCPGIVQGDLRQVIWLAKNEIPIDSTAVQLGAFYSLADAVMAANNNPRLDQSEVGHGYYIQRATLNKRVIFRLRFGLFENLSEAKQYCTELMSRQRERDCIPVKIRQEVSDDPDDGDEDGSIDLRFPIS